MSRDCDLRDNHMIPFAFIILDRPRCDIKRRVILILLFLQDDDQDNRRLTLRCRVLAMVICEDCLVSL